MPFTLVYIIFLSIIKKRPGVDGVTVESSVTSSNAGGCWCETGVKGHNDESHKYKTCYLQPAGKTI